MNRLPQEYRSAIDLPFNRSSLQERFRLESPDKDPLEPGYWVAIRGSDLLVHNESDVLTLPFGPAAKFGWGGGFYIGQWDGQPCRLVGPSRGADVPETLDALSLISPEPLLPIDLLSLGGMARMIRHWEHESLYCGRCGVMMERLPGEWGKSCPKCSTHHFPRIHPCAIVLVQRPGEVLLIRKPEWAPNRYSLAAGFLEFGECLEETAAREVLEETGVRIDNIRYVGSQSWPFPSQLMCGFVADYVGGEVVADTTEVEDARWFKVDALPALPPKRSIARFILDTALKGLS